MERVTVNMPDDVAEEVRRLAEADERSIAGTALRLIRSGLAAQTDERAKRVLDGLAERGPTLQERATAGRPRDRDVQPRPKAGR